MTFGERLSVSNGIGKFVVGFVTLLGSLLLLVFSLIYAETDGKGQAVIVLTCLALFAGGVGAILHSIYKCGDVLHKHRGVYLVLTSRALHISLTVFEHVIDTLIERWGLVSTHDEDWVEAQLEGIQVRYVSGSLFSPNGVPCNGYQAGKVMWVLQTEPQVKDAMMHEIGHWLYDACLCPYGPGQEAAHRYFRDHNLEVAQ